MLYLYKEITPNLDNKHYYFTTISQYKNALSSKLVKSISLDSYRINTNLIKVKLDNVLTENIADQITYAIDEREENGTIVYFRAYHVNRITIQSGYVSLYCSVDLWASYLIKAQLSNINVLRCNRRIGTGILDEIDGTKGSVTRTYCATTGTSDGPSGTSNELMARENVYIVFALKYNIAQNSAGAVSRIGLYAFKIKNLVTRLLVAQENPNDFYYTIVNPVDLAIDVVSGIYGITGTNMWGGSGTLNAVVIGAWLTDLVSAIESTDIEIKTKPNWHRFEDVTLTPYEIITTEVTRNITIQNDFNKQLYFGTKHNTLKLQRTTEENITITLKMLPSSDKITIIACQGDTQQDITDAFSVVVGMTDGDITTERQVLDVLQNSIKGVAGAIALGKGVASENGFATALGVTSLASGVADEIGKGRNTHVGSMVKGGDGVLAFWRVFTGQDTENPLTNLGTPVHNPYLLSMYESINDEKVNVRLYGAKFSEKVTSIESIFNYALMGTGSANDATFVQANVNVDGIPTEASDKIKATLQKGVYLIKLNT